ADLFLQRGVLQSTPRAALAAGFLDALVDPPTGDALLARARDEIRAAHAAAWFARADAKREARRPVLAAMHDPGLGAVAASIAGDEFQKNVAGILDRLAKRKS
ncbi:hypothetical protein HK405_015994, partial [Cladochytrium tenue]